MAIFPLVTLRAAQPLQTLKQTVAGPIANFSSGACAKLRLRETEEDLNARATRH